MSRQPTTESRPAADEWLNRVRGASAGPELLEIVTRRLVHPYDEGPTLDDRRGEGPEEVFERMAESDEDFRVRLDRTIADYFNSPASCPADEASRPVIRGALERVQRRALTGAFAPLRAWIKRYEADLRAEAGAYLARAALGALATAQPQGLAEVRDFWLYWWRNGPSSWQPRAFIGLRLQDPGAAAEEIPLLLGRARAQQQDPGALLHGMWNQPGGRDALLAWLQQNNEKPEADDVRRVLRPRVSEADIEKLSKPKPPRRRRELPSLATSEPEPRVWWS